jgi:hypothetical protein
MFVARLLVGLFLARKIPAIARGRGSLVDICLCSRLLEVEILL